MSRYDWGKRHPGIGRVEEQIPVLEAIDQVNVPGRAGPAAEFIRPTWGLIESAPVNAQAAAFAFGRDDLVPGMFQQVAGVNERLGSLGTFIDYLARHSQVDADERTPMAMRMLADLCGEDRAKRAEPAGTVNLALEARARLWDGIVAAIGGPGGGGVGVARTAGCGGHG